MYCVFNRRKVSKAAIALVPLLGITNFILVILPEPHSKSPELFAFWSYTAHILHSFQGLMVSILYCFMNKEVSTYLHILKNAFLVTFSVKTVNRTFPCRYYFITPKVASSILYF